MIDIFMTAVNGMRLAEARALQAATNISEMRITEAEQAATSPTGATQGVVTGPAPGESPVTGGEGFPACERDLATDFVELKIAQHTYEANVAVLRTADQMTRRLLESLR